MYFNIYVHSYILHNTNKSKTIYACDQGLYFPLLGLA